jgi:hypothetical protein
MNIIFAGKFENALLRAITAQADPTRLVNDNDYYRSLHRYAPRSYFDRCATFIAIANHILVTADDWNFRQAGFSVPPQMTEDQLGISYALQDATNMEGREDIKSFAALLLKNRAFSDMSRQSLAEVTGPLEPTVKTWRSTHGIEGADWFSLHQLERLLLQVRCSVVTKSRLVLGDEELEILRDICSFIETTRIPSPISLPDLRGANRIHGETFAGGLLNFSPPDTLAVAAVRADSGIRAYATKIREILSEQSTVEGQRKLVHAMREALDKDEIEKRTQNIFEVVSWIAKPLHYIPGVDAMMCLGEDAFDLGKKWLDRKKTTDDWFILGARMTDISLRDYLKRTDNL